MAKELWLNLPVKDLKKSTEFFSKLGFNLNPRFNDSAEMAGLMVGNTNVMLIPEPTFESFVKHKVADTDKGSEIIISIDAESRAEVDDLARKAEQAGGKIYGEPGENQGWMYGCGFTDVDGHRWNVLYMDMSKMPR